jgi:dipeptidyl aminopeptidase/acylaminoacyl peptidase
VEGIAVNAAYGDAVQWMPDSKSLLAEIVPAGRRQPPAAPPAPLGPTIQESSGRAGPVRTFQDLLQSAHDEALFDYYFTSQLVLIGLDDRKPQPIGKPAIFAGVNVSPDGRHILVTRNQRPYSYILPAFRFPKEVEVWDLAGKLEFKLASLPLQDRVPIEGVPTGPRNANWRPTEPATLVWAEALDEGDPKKKVPYRDRILSLKAPFTGEAKELLKTEHRYAGIQWGEKDGLALFSDYDRDRRWSQTFLVYLDRPEDKPRLLWDLSVNDMYGDPGSPIMRPLPSGRRVMWQQGESIFLAGRGATPRGDRPFLDRFNFTTQKTERLFQCDEASFEAVAALLADDGSQFITRHESPTDPPNYFVRTAAGGRRRLTNFPDPMPQLRNIKKELVTYNRADGVALSFTLYLPPDHKPGERLPTVVWAYPREYNDAGTAGQVSGSTNHFTTIGGMSHLFFLTQGYAILDDATMPVVGDPETANNTYIEQIVASAKAAIDKAAEMGVTDPNRVGVGGHSYGAFMTANLLAHCDLFRAGIARSGAYNRTLTPFGFQAERRTLWEAPEIYLKMSPLMVANKINEPILLIHGEADNNSGTFPIQSERMYHAVRGNGGTVRYVTLPHESHGYAARESIEHTLYEMVSWFERHVKYAEKLNTDQKTDR